MPKQFFLFVPRNIFYVTLFSILTCSILNGACVCMMAQEAGDRLTAGPADDSEKVAPGKIDTGAERKFTTTKSGLKYRILRKGKKDGKLAKSTDSVTVHYKGWLDNQKIFDSSYRRGETISFPLNRVIPGWTEGMQLVREGGMIELEIPSKLGYGANGAGRVIPPNATLHFVVELVTVK